MARYNVLDPPSSNIDFVFLYKATSCAPNFDSGVFTSNCFALRASLACSCHKTSPVLNALRSGSILVFKTFSAETNDIFTPSAKKSSNFAGFGHNMAKLLWVILQFNSGLLGDRFNNFFCQILSLVVSDISVSLYLVSSLKSGKLFGATSKSNCNCSSVTLLWLSSLLLDANEIGLIL